MTRDLRPSITCSKCGATSYHPADVEHLYCANCHSFIADDDKREHVACIAVTYEDGSQEAQLLHRGSFGACAEVLNARAPAGHTARVLDPHGRRAVKAEGLVLSARVFDQLTRPVHRWQS
jgi:hypothetical protein